MGTAFIVTNMHLYRYCQLIKNCFCIKPQEFNLEDMNAQIKQWFGTMGWFIQILGGCFHQKNDYPTFFIIWQSLTINHVKVKNLG